MCNCAKLLKQNVDQWRKHCKFERSTVETQEIRTHGAGNLNGTGKTRNLNVALGSLFRIYKITK